MKYTLKCATGLFRIRRLNSANAPKWGAWWVIGKYLNAVRRFRAIQ